MILTASYESPCGVMSIAIGKLVGDRMRLRIPMRGYESFSMSPVLPLVSGYESPCGVMSSATICASSCIGMLRIPMRGYEEVSGQAIDALQQVLRIPMRGYEIVSVLPVVRATPVTNPHAGL